MTDALILAALFAFFGVSRLFVALCEHLVER